MRKVAVIILIIISVSANARIRYVSTRGNDLNAGTDSSSTGAWATWKKGFAEAMPGDTVYFMGGIYYSTGKIIVNPTTWSGFERGIGHSGTAENPIMYSSYPGQWAILDCSQHCENKPYDPIGNPYYNSALEFYCVRNIHLKDFEIQNVFQCDAVLTGAIVSYLSCYMTFEHLVLHGISNRAFEVEGGAFKSFEPYMTWTDVKSYWNFDVDTIRFINCDIYDVCDSLGDEIGNGGDVFHTSLYPENVMIWEGCRLWNYADDGFNAAGAGGLRIIDNCWMMPSNKYYWTNGVFETERNGCKAGWNAHPFTDQPWLWPIPTQHNTLQVSNSLVMFGEIAFREGPNNIGYYHNNTIYKCGLGFDSTIDPTPEHPYRPSYKNNLCHKMSKNNAFGLPYMVWLYGTIPYEESNNSWVRTGSEPYFQVNTAFTTTDADFIGLEGDDYADSLYLVSLFLAPRQADGSLPAIKPLTLAPTSDLIDAGTRIISVGTQNVDFTLTTPDYEGNAPDIGYAEFKSGVVTPPTPVYLSSVIENATPARLEMAYNLTLANIIPATSAFTVRVNSVVRNVTTVTISGTKVLLTLASPVAYGDVVTVAYTKPASNPLQTAAGGQATSIAAQNVKNNVVASVPVYLSSVIENATPARLEMAYNLTLANIIPATSAFTVRVNSVVRNVTTVTISGTKVLLTLASPVAYGDVVTVAYTKPASNPLQTAAGGQAVSLAAQNVANNVAVSVPVYVSSVIENATPARLEMAYTLTLANIIPATSAFTVRVNSVVRNVTAVTISGTKVFLTLASPVANGDVVTVAYTKPASNPLQTPAGGQAVSLAPQSVINNCSEVANQPPVVTLVSPVKSTTYTSPANITIEATASDPDGSITKVEFFSGSTLIGTINSSPFTYVWKNVTEGRYLLTAIATDNQNAKSVSEAVEVVVEKSSTAVNQLPVITISYTVRGNSKKPRKHDSVKIIADTYDPDGTISKVEFKNGSVILAEVSTAPYEFTIEDIEEGLHIITATAFDNLNASSTSAPIEISVSAIPEYSDLIDLYPNPNSGSFAVEIKKDQALPNCQLTILNMAGSKIITVDIADFEVYKEFDITNSAAGPYIIMLTSNNKILATRKLIKQ